MRNIIVSNSCGLFSSFLNFFSWMSLSSENDFNIFLNVFNKTDDWNNAITTPNNPFILSNDFDRSLIDKNILLNIFKEGNYISKEYPEDFVFVEHYPHLYKKSIQNYPDYLFKYDGKGGMPIVYNDTQNLDLVRKTFNSCWKDLEFTDDFGNLVRDEEKLIEGKKTLSIMLRTIYHYVNPNTGQIADESDVESFIKEAIKCVSERMDEYDSVLITTQNQPYVDAFVKEFGDKCIFTDRPRFSDFNDWRGVGKDTHELTDAEYETEVKNCLLDVILTSKVDHIIGTCSNMFLGALSLNTESTYELISSNFWGA